MLFFYQCDFNIAYDVIMKYKQLNESKNMKQRNVIRLTESDLKRIISESVKSVLRENNEDRRNFDSEWEFSPERDDAFQEWLDKANSLDIDGSEDDKGEALDNLIGNDPSYGQWYDNMRKKHETDYLWRKHGEFNEHPFKDDEMDMMWSEYGLSNESYKRRGKVRLTESNLKRIISESVKNIISELDWKTYANAASAAKDRESIFKDDPGYPDRPMTRHYKDDGSLDMEKYQRDSDWQVNQSKQPEKFRQAAYSGLSKEICGEEDFALFLAKYIRQHGPDDKLLNMIQQYNDGQEYIRNNKTKWSKRR